MFIRYDEILEERGIIPFIRPFSTELWRAILASIILAGISTFIIIYVWKVMTNTSHTFGIINAFYHPIEAFMNQRKQKKFTKLFLGIVATGKIFVDGAGDPEIKSIRITIITTRFLALFIVPAYSAFLLTYLLQPNIQLPFKDMKGLVKDGSYKIGFSKKTNFQNWFKVSEKQMSIH